MRKSLMAVGIMACYCQAVVEGTAGTTAAVTETAKTAEQVAAEAAAKAALHQKIMANFDNKVDVKDYKFGFKKVKDEATGLESKRPTVELSLPVPSVEGIIKILETGGKQLELLQEAVAEVIQERAREIVNDKEDINQDNFPMDQLSWETISNLPKAERRGGGIGKETWDEFALDYCTVMPAVTKKSADQVGNAAKILLNKFNAVKTNKPVLKLLKDQLGLYVTNSPNAETYAECVDFLVKKADALLSVDEAQLLANL